MTGYHRINAGRARELRGAGLTWRQVAAVLSQEEGRRVPYQSAPVQRAVLNAFGTSKVPRGWVAANDWAQGSIFTISIPITAESMVWGDTDPPVFRSMFMRYFLPTVDSIVQDDL